MSKQTAAESGNGRPPSRRLLIFTKYFYPSTGGVQKHIDVFAEGMLGAGWNPTVVTETEAEGFDDRQLPYPVIRRPGLMQLWRLLGEADVLHLAGPPFIPLLLARLRGTRVAIEHHNYQAVCPNGLLLYQPNQQPCSGHFMAGEYGKCVGCGLTNAGLLSSLRSLAVTFFRRYLCKHVAVNVAITKHVERRLQLPRSQVIYHGLPDPLPGPSPDPSSDKQPVSPPLSPPLCFAYVGRLVAEKGLPVLVDAASRLRKAGYAFRLKFIGDGPQRTLLEEMVAAGDLKEVTTFTGFLGGEAFRQATEDVAAVVMPSVWEETAGLAAMEQMLRCRLVIASDIGGLGEIVDGAGLKFAAGNAEQLAACMQRVVDEPQLVHEIGQRARQRSLQLFTEDRKTRAYVDLFGGLLQHKAKRPAAPRVLIYSVDFWPLVGGLESILMFLARGLADGKQALDGADVTVVTETPGDSASDRNLPFRVVRKPSRIELFRLMKQSDVIHLAGPALLPLLFGLFFRKRVVVEHHGFQAMCPNGLMQYEPTCAGCPGHFMAGRYRKCLQCNARQGRWRSLKLLALTFPRRWLCALMQGNIAPTHWLSGLLKLPRTTVIWHSIAENRPLPPPANNRPATFIFVGRLVSTKGVHLLLEAASRLRQRDLPFRMVIVGDGPERARLEQKARDLRVDDRVEFAGYLPDTEVEEVIAKAVAVVMPSVAGEVFGLVAAETMMRARLIVVPDSGALAEVVGDTGVKFRTDDPDDLAACLERILAAPEWASAIVEQGRRRSLDEFLEPRMTEAHLRLYRDVLQ